jgi:hypothetical protein
MPRLVDDARYRSALQATARMLEAEHHEFRKRLALRMGGLVSAAIDEMGDTFDEAILRRALEGYGRVFVEESLAYIRRALVQSGQIEIAKRMAELADKVRVEDLPVEFQRAFAETQQTGWRRQFEDESLPEGQLGSGSSN